MILSRKARPGKNPALPPPTTVEGARLGVVKWMDAHADEGWTGPDEWQTAPARHVVTVGWVLLETHAKPEHVTVAQDHDAEAGRWCGVSHIPYGMLVSIRFLT